MKSTHRIFVRLLLAAASVSLALSASATDQIGIFFDSEGTVTTATTTAPMQVLTAYVMLMDPPSSGGITGWECELSILTDGPDPQFTWTLPPTSLNIATPPRFAVGIGTPLPAGPRVVLATATILVPEAGQTIDFHISAYDPPSLQDPPASGYYLWQPIYNHGALRTLDPLTQASGCESLPVARINPGDDVPSPVLTGPARVCFDDGGAAFQEFAGQFVNPTDRPFAGVVTISGNGYQIAHGDGAYMTEPTWLHLAPGESKNLRVYLTNAPGTPQVGQITVTSCDGEIFQCVVSDDCAGSADVYFDPSSLAFGPVPVGTTVWQQSELINATDTPVTISLSELAENPAFEIAAPLEFDLPALGQATVSVGFHPQAEGATSMTVATGVAGAELACTGTGLPSCELMMPQAGYFGVIFVGDTVTQTFAVANTSAITIAGDVALATTGTDFAITAGGGPFSLAPGDTLHGEVTFAPQSDGPQATTLLAGANCDIDLTGTGVPVVEECALTPTTLDFSNVAPGGSRTLGVTVTNTGNVPLEIAPVPPAAPFAIASNGDPATLAPGTSRVVGVRFSPDAEGLYAGTLDLGASACASVPLSGVGADPAQLEQVGVFFDADGTLTETTTTAPGQEVTAYVVLINPHAAEDITGWECRFSVFTDGPDPDILWEVAGNGLNIGTPPAFAVGLGIPLPWASRVVLATARITVPEAGQSIDFHVGAYDPPSLRQPPGSMYYLWQPVYNHGPLRTLDLMTSASGCESLPTARINPVAAPTEPALIGPLRVCFDDALAGDQPLTVQLINPTTVPIAAELSMAGTGPLRVAHHGGALTDQTTWIRLEPGETMELQVVLTNTPGQHQQGNLVVSTCDGAIFTVPYDDSCTDGGGLYFDPDQLAFGNVTVGATVALSTPLYNNTASPIAVSLSEVQDNPAFVITPPLAYEIAPFDSAVVTVNFAPQTLGATSVVVTTGATGALLACAGTGTPACAVGAPQGADFGEVPQGTSLTRPFAVINTTAEPIAGDIVLANANTDFTITLGAGAFALAPGDTHHVEVTFAPRVYGEQTNLLQAGALCELAITGVSHDFTGACEITPEVVDFGAVLVDVPTTRALTIHNAGSLPFTVDLQLASPVFSIVSGGGVHEIAPSGNLVASVRCLATDIGDFTATIAVGSPYCATVPVQASAAPPTPDCDWNGATVADFGNVAVGLTTTQSIVYRNTGNVSLTDVTFTAQGAGFSIVSGGGPVSIPPGQTQDITVQFAPAQQAAYTGALVPSTDACDPLPLQGVGAPPPPPGSILMAFDTNGIDTRATTTAPNQTVTAYLLMAESSIPDLIYGWECTVQITTGGPQPVVIWELAGVNPLNIGTPPEFIVGLQLPMPHGVVVVLATATIVVPDPDSEIEFRILSVPRPSVVSPPGYPVELPAWAGAPGHIFSLTPASGCSGEPVAWINDNDLPVPQNITTDDVAAFGAVSVGGEATRTVTLTNNTSITTSGVLSLTGDAYAFRHGDGDWTTEPVWCRLDPGENLDLDVRFAPTVSGPQFGDIVLEGCGPVFAAALSGGGGEAPPAALAPNPLEFGITSLNSGVEHACTVTNSGSTSLDFAPFVVESDGFALVDDTPFTLPAGGSQDLAVRFSATSPGLHLGRVALGQSLAPDLLVHGMALIATGECLVTLDGNGSGDCGNVVVGYPVTRVATILNIGDDPIDGFIGFEGATDVFTITDGGGFVELAPGGNHEVTIEVAPQEPGDYGATLVSLGGCSTVGFHVVGLPAITACAVSPVAIDFGAVIVDTTATVVVTVKNTGTLPLDLDPELPAGPFVITAGGDPVVLAAADSVLVRLAFTPPALESYSATLTLGADACSSVPLSGSGRPWGGLCVLEPEVLDGGTTPANIPVLITLTVRNEGEDSFAIDPVLDSPVFTLIDGVGVSTIDPGYQRAITVRFVAGAPGDYTGELDLQTDGCPVVPLIATATAPVVACDWGGLEDLDWGPLPSGGIYTEVVHYRNIGNVPLQAVTFAVEGPGFAITSGAGPVTIAPGGSHSITLTFTPLDDTPYSGALITPVGGCSVLPLLGEGLATSPGLLLDPDHLAFGASCVGSPLTQMVTLTALGAVPQLVYPQITGAGFSLPGIAGGDSLILAPNVATPVTVVFTPDAPGSYSGELAFGLFYPAAVPLTGSGVEPQAICVVDHDLLDFGQVGVGRGADLSLMVGNNGCEPLTIVPAITGNDFAFLSGGDAGVLEPGTSREIVVHFAPDALGLFTGSLDLGTLGCPSVLLMGEGIEIVYDCYTLPAYLNVDFLPVGHTRLASFVIYNGATAAVSLNVNDVPDRATVVSGGGAITVQPGQTHTVSAQFGASVLGETIWDWDFGLDCRPLTVIVFGANQICHVAPAYLDFGTVPLGGTAERNWVVSNPGIEGLMYDPQCDDPNYVVEPDAPQSLPPGTYFSGAVRFSPQTVGTHDVELVFNHPTSYPIDLLGIATAQIALKRFDLPRLEFGPVGPGETLTRACVLINDGTDPLTGTIALANRDFRVVEGAGSVTVPAGGRHTVRVRYTPQTTGEHMATIVLEGTDLEPVALLGRCLVTDPDSNRVTIVWDDGIAAMDAASDLFGERELTGRLVLRQPTAVGGVFAWQGRLLATGDGHFASWQYAAGAANRAEAPTFEVVASGVIPPPTEEITLATFHYVVPAGGTADFALAAVAGEEVVGWPAWFDASAPDSALVAMTTDGSHLLATIRPDGHQTLPGLVRLHAPYPNPFNPMTTVAFDLGEPGHARLEIFDLMGRKVCSLLDAALPAGRHEIVWQGVDDAGRTVASGGYHVRLTAGGKTQTRKLTLLK